MNLTYILKQPIITEKSLKDASVNVFTFEVDLSATKDQIKQAVEQQYQVKVISVNTAKLAGKAYRLPKTRQTRVRPDSKKARITLKAGDKINLFELDQD